MLQRIEEPAAAVESVGDDRSRRKASAVLVIGPGWVGDMVMAQGLFHALRQRDPAVAIDVMAAGWAEPLLARMPEVRHWLDAPFPRRALALLDRIRAGRRLAGRYDAAYVLPGSWKSALVPLFARVPHRIGYRREWRYGLLNDCRALPREGRRRTAETFFRLAGGGRFVPPRLRIDVANQAALLRRHGLGGRPFVAFMPGADYGPAKRWPPHHYAAVANDLHRQGLSVALLGAPGDAPVGAAIAALAPGVVDLCGKTRLVDTVDLLAAARIAVSNDTGLMHIAAAVETPVVAVYGSTSPDNTPPLSDRSDLVTLRLACSPCHDRQCRFGHTNCLERLEPARISAAIDRLLVAAA